MVSFHAESYEDRTGEALQTCRLPRMHLECFACVPKYQFVSLCPSRDSSRQLSSSWRRAPAVSSAGNSKPMTV